MPEPQTYKNHTRFDPVWHYFIAPVLLLNILFSIAATIHHWPNHRILFCWWILLSIVLFMAVGKARGHSLKAQDRIIRLEERLRMAALLSPEEFKRSSALTESPADRPALRGRRRVARAGQAHTRPGTDPEADQGIDQSLETRLLPRLVDVALVALLLLHRGKVLGRRLRRALRPHRDRVQQLLLH